MHTIQTMVYQFSELSEDAKEKAREWYRELALNYDWWDATYEDAARVGLEIKGFDLYHKQIRARLTFMSSLESAKAIKTEHGEQCDTYKLAEEFLAQVAGLRMLSPDFKETPEYEELCSEYEKDLGKCYLSVLESEYEYLLSDECVDETILANDYTFTESGKRFG